LTKPIDPSRDPEAPGGYRTEQLLQVLYTHLKRMAGAQMEGLAPGQTLQPTALVHEAYLKLRGAEWPGRGPFLAAAARAMRNVLVDHARSRGRQKRGGGARRWDVDEAVLISNGPDPRLLDLEDALNRLEKWDARKAEVVTLRYFGGLGIDETAAVLGVGHATVEREWAFAKAWLRRELEDDPP
jgi:RNA polymerase sigma factor (TIGR02999 family)